MKNDNFNKTNKLKNQSKTVFKFSFIFILIWSVYIPTFCNAQIVFEGKGELPDGWQKGSALFETEFHSILKPITIDVQSQNSSALDAWIDQTADGKFTLSLGNVPRSSERNAVVAVHELTHALHITYRPHEEKWLQEGLALLSEFLVFKKESVLEKAAYQSLETSFTPPSSLMTKASHQNPSMFALYGEWRLFFKFLFQHCGGNETFFRILTLPSNKTGIEFMDLVLSQPVSSTLPIYCSTFDKVFTEFEIRKFTQNLNRGLDLSPYRGRISDIKSEIVEPYSAQAYYNPGNCDGDIVIDSNTCLQIRLK